MKVLLVDDEKSMLLIMKKMLSKIPDVDIAGCFQSTNEAFGFLKENGADLLFVDINMPEESGLDFAKRVLAEIEDVAVAFITAYRDYALEAFDVDAFDYIVKPVTQARLETSIQRARKRLIPQRSAIENMPSKNLSVYCLGSMEVRNNAGRTIQFTSSKSYELLAYLLLKKGRFVSKWSILDDVFSEMSPQNAETYLNTTIYKLRKALEPFGMKSAIISVNESYKADIRDIYIDFYEFENRITLLSDINSSNIEEALKTEALYEGELFGDKDYYWALPEKERLSEVYWSFAKRLSGFLIEIDHITGALQVLRKLLYINELDEDINCLLFKVYYAQRDKTSLEKRYEQYKKALCDELGVSPENSVTSLYSELIRALG